MMDKYFDLLTDDGKYLDRIVNGKDGKWYIYLKAICHNGYFYPRRNFCGKDLSETIKKSKNYIKTVCMNTTR
jgi:hypothetical protein